MKILPVSSPKLKCSVKHLLKNGRNFLALHIKMDYAQNLIKDPKKDKHGLLVLNYMTKNLVLIKV